MRKINAAIVTLFTIPIQFIVFDAIGAVLFSYTVLAAWALMLFTAVMGISICSPIIYSLLVRGEKVEKKA